MDCPSKWSNFECTFGCLIPTFTNTPTSGLSLTSSFRLWSFPIIVSVMYYCHIFNQSFIPTFICIQFFLFIHLIPGHIFFKNSPNRSLTSSLYISKYETRTWQRICQDGDEKSEPYSPRSSCLLRFLQCDRIYAQNCWV